MRSLTRNKQKLYYALYNGKAEITEDNLSNPIRTGVYQIVYKAPVQIYASISAAKGDSEVNGFGTELDYTKTMIVTDMNCPIDENSALWIDKDPEIDERSGLAKAPHNYIVIKVAKSLNNIQYAIKELN